MMLILYGKSCQELARIPRSMTPLPPTPSPCYQLTPQGPCWPSLLTFQYRLKQPALYIWPIANMLTNQIKTFNFPYWTGLQSHSRLYCTFNWHNDNGALKMMERCTFAANFKHFKMSEESIQVMFWKYKKSLVWVGKNPHVFFFFKCAEKKNHTPLLNVFKSRHWRRSKWLILPERNICLSTEKTGSCVVFSQLPRT